MSNQSVISALIFTLIVALPLSVYSQDAPAQSPGDLQLGEELVDGVPVGTTYTKEEYGDWDMRCILTADGNDPCQLYQLMQDENGNSVAEISLFELENSGQAIAGATLAAPLETLLTEQMTLTVDGETAKRYPFSYCSVQGCYVRIGLTEEDIATFKHGTSATVIIVPVAAPDRRLGLKLSLIGFTKGFEALQLANKALISE